MAGRWVDKSVIHWAELKVCCSAELWAVETAALTAVSSAVAKAVESAVWMVEKKVGEMAAHLAGRWGCLTLLLGELKAGQMAAPWDDDLAEMMVDLTAVGWTDG